MDLHLLVPLAPQEASGHKVPQVLRAQLEPREILDVKVPLELIWIVCSI